MAEATLSVSSTTVVQETRAPSPRLRLKLKKPKNDKKVKWTNDTVDNEHMNKKKSKCCCIYEKPRMFGESSSEEDDDDCDHCRGHRKKCYKADDNDTSDHSGHSHGGMDEAGPSGS